MPTYEYRCSNGHHFELFQKMSDAPATECPDCGSAAERKLSGGAGFLFKGDGFYITDNRSDSYKKDASSDKEAGGGSSNEKAGAESSPTKSDSSSTKSSGTSSSSSEGASSQSSKSSDSTNSSKG